MSKEIKPTAEEPCINIPQLVFTKALAAAKEAKDVVMPYLPSMSQHTQRHAAGMTIRNTEFMEEGLRIAESNPEFVSTFIDLTQYEKDVAEFLDANAVLSELQVATSNWNAVRRWAGIQARRDFNILYGCVREMANRNIAPAIPLYHEMSRIYANLFGPRGSRPCGTHIEAQTEHIVIEAKQLVGENKHIFDEPTQAKIIKELEVR